MVNETREFNPELFLESQVQRWYGAERKGMRAADILPLVRQTRERGKKVLTLTDFDLTASHILPEKPNGEDDPTQSQFDPVVGAALTKLESLGQENGIVSDRDGRQVQKMAQAVGLTRPHLRTTFSYESRHVDPNDPDRWQSTISEPYAALSEPISESLAAVQERLMALPTLRMVSGDWHAMRFHTLDGQLLLERKGRVEGSFDYGLAFQLHMVFYDPAKRETLLRELTTAYERRKEQLLADHPLAEPTFAAWGMERDSWKPEERSRFSLKFEPLRKRNKAYGTLQVLKELREQNIGMIIAAGDNPQKDGQMMWALNVAAAAHPARCPEEPFPIVNVLVNPSTEIARNGHDADFRVANPRSFGQLLTLVGAEVTNASS